MIGAAAAPRPARACSPACPTVRPASLCEVGRGPLRIRATPHLTVAPDARAADDPLPAREDTRGLVWHGRMTAGVGRSVVSVRVRHGPDEVRARTPVVAGTWGVAVDTRPLREGVARVTFAAVDGLGRTARSVETRVRIDRTPPTVVLDAPAHASGRFPVVVAFSEPVEGMRADALDVVGGRVAHLDGDGAVYVAHVVPHRDADAVRITIEPGATRDAAGHANARADVVSVDHESPPWSGLFDGAPTRWVATLPVR